MLKKNAIILTLPMVCSACIAIPTLPTGTETGGLPLSDTASIKTFKLSGLIISERKYRLTYFDGVESEIGFIPFGGKILAGNHRLGILVRWGGLCIPGGYFGSLCFNQCYSGVVLKAEAGRKYDYDIQKNEDGVWLLVKDDVDSVVSKSVCEKVPLFEAHYHSSRNMVIKSIQERIDREFKEIELQNKHE